MYNFDSYNVLLTIATNIPVLLMTAFVLQRHKYDHASLTNRRIITPWHCDMRIMPLKTCGLNVWDVGAGRPELMEGCWSGELKPQSSNPDSASAPCCHPLCPDSGGEVHHLLRVRRDGSAGMMFDWICVFVVCRKRLLWRTCSVLRDRSSRDAGYRTWTSREKRPNYADNTTKTSTTRWTSLTIWSCQALFQYVNNNSSKKIIMQRPLVLLGAHLLMQVILLGHVSLCNL